MSSLEALDESQPGLSTELAEAARSAKLNSRTIQTYKHWIILYLVHFDLANPAALSEQNVSEFLRHQLKQMTLSRARMNQAREALFFFYAQVLKQPLQTKEVISA